MLDKCEILLPQFSPRYPKCAILNGVHPADDLESLGCWGRRHEWKIGHNKGTKARPRTRTACQACLSLTKTLVRTKPEWNLTTQLFGSCNGRQQAPIKLSKDLDPTIEQTSNYLHVRSYSSGSRCARTARLNPNHLSYMAVFMVGVACASGHGAAIWCFGHGEPSQKWTVFYSSGTEPQWRPVECASTVNMRQNL